LGILAAEGSAPSRCKGGVHTNMTRLFISHSSTDGDFVRELQQALGDLDQDLQLDSRQLRGGDPLWSDIQDAIEEASAFAIVVSPSALQSPWVSKELRHALELQKLAGQDEYSVIPLSLDNTPLGAEDLGEVPICIAVPSAANGATAVAHSVLAALGKRSPPVAPAPVSATPPTPSERVASPPLDDAHFESPVKARNTWDHEQFQTLRTRIERQVESGQLSEAFDGARQLLQRALDARETAYSGADFDLAGAGYLLGVLFEKAGRAEQASTLLGEAQKRFEAIAQQQPTSEAERMACTCLGERGGCLIAQRRFDEATTILEESISRALKGGYARQVAASNDRLGVVRLKQCRYQDALLLFGEARSQFSALGESNGEGSFWHQSGMVYEKAGEMAAAEDAYRTSLACNGQLGNAAAQALTLNHLGGLYDAMDRTEEAVACLRQAVDKSVESRNVAYEGASRTNLGEVLRKLGRLAEGRRELHRAIECKSQFGHATEPWVSWHTLANVEIDAEDFAAATEARQKSIQCYIAYRRDGGENDSGTGRLVVDMAKALRAGGTSVAAEFLDELAADPRAKGSFCTFIQALQAVVKGSRDRRLANAPDLDYTMAAEVLLLIEKLEQRG
jgi:tetratricopeptide (TPR) repeat protein